MSDLDKLFKEKPVKYTLMNHLGRGRSMGYYNVKEVDDWISQASVEIDKLLFNVDRQTGLHAQYYKLFHKAIVHKEQIDEIMALLDEDDKNYQVPVGERYNQLIHLVNAIETVMGR